MAAMRIGPVDMVALEELLEALQRASDLAAETALKGAVGEARESAKELLCRRGEN